MTWSAYGEFLAFAVVLVLIPGPDFAVVTKNALIRTEPAFQALKSAAVAYLALAAGLGRARRLLLRRKIRRALDGATAAALLGFSARPAAEHA